MVALMGSHAPLSPVRWGQLLRCQMHHGGSAHKSVAMTERTFCANNQPCVVVMIREGPSYCSHFATNTTTIHYFPSVPHPMEESPLPIYIEEGTEVPIGECSWDGIFLRGGIMVLGVYIPHVCVYPFVFEKF